MSSPTESSPASDVTRLLHAWGNGDVEARDHLVPLVYAELRRRAAAQLRRERAGDSLQPTALVHEAYLRLVRQDQAGWQNRTHFFAIASLLMRRILVDRARARGLARRSGQWQRITLHSHVAEHSPVDVDFIDLDRALTELEGISQRKSQVAQLRFFGGLSLQETADVLGISLATVEREWQAARAWLFARLTGRLGQASGTTS